MRGDAETVIGLSAVNDSGDAVGIVGGMEKAPTYVSRVRIVRDRGPIRQAYLPIEREPVIFGTHDEIREHYGTAPGQYPDHATTIDYVVAAAAG